MNTLRILLLIGLLGCGSLAQAQHGGAKPAEPMSPLLEGLGPADHKITTADPMAQAYFNQGLRLMYAFNHDEAIKAFRAAETIDPDCAMAQWGIAVALGPNYNLEADPEKAEATVAALRKAQQLVKNATPREQDYVAALSVRYSEDPKANRQDLDRAYANAMRDLAAGCSHGRPRHQVLAPATRPIGPAAPYRHERMLLAVRSGKGCEDA